MKTTMTTPYTFRLTGEDILSLLVEAGEIDAAHNATIKIQVPPGGKYSGRFIPVDDNCPVLVWV